MDLLRTTLLGLASIGMMLFLSGCVTDNGFNNEEYVWENWSVSTNTINIIEVGF